jgi:hypothetical protein
MTSLTLTNVANWTLPILKQQPLNVNNQEPGLTNGNMVLQHMLSPPLRWRWNRGTFSFTCIPLAAGPPIVNAKYDYPLSLSDFGYLEDQWIIDPDKGDVYPLAGALSLNRPTVVTPSRVTQIAPQNDDGAGNIVFRTKEIPNKAYTIEGEYQKKPTLIVSMASTFGPVPDEFAFVFNLGYLTFCSLLINDSRFPIFERYYISRLLSLHGGLDEQDYAIFTGNWMSYTATVQRSANKVAAASAARSQ